MLTARTVLQCTAVVIDSSQGICLIGSVIAYKILSLHIRATRGLRARSSRSSGRGSRLLRREPLRSQPYSCGRAIQSRSIWTTSLAARGYIFEFTLMCSHAQTIQDCCDGRNPRHGRRERTKGQWGNLLVAYPGRRGCDSHLLKRQTHSRLGRQVPDSSHRGACNEIL